MNTFALMYIILCDVGVFLTNINELRESKKKKINSPKFDAYFIHTGKQLYWSSNRDGERSDIYLANILTPPPVSIACKGTDATVNA